ncbi:MAG: Arm DNA-binding domain-containing protein, partial [Ruminococcus sp.]|nr:Arm DNA-binding domain-containing protein [Ruminococcus sp.]
MVKWNGNKKQKERKPCLTKKEARRRAM